MYDSNEMVLEFESKSKNESFARTVVAAFATQLDPTIEELADIKTAVSEAVTNAIVHGYPDYVGIIQIRCTIKGRDITVEIRDKGIGIDNIEQAREPLYTSRPELERSGMGFSFMEAFMDTLEVTSTIGEGTTVKMRKRVGKAVSSNEFSQEADQKVV